MTPTPRSMIRQSMPWLAAAAFLLTIASRSTFAAVGRSNSEIAFDDMEKNGEKGVQIPWDTDGRITLNGTQLNIPPYFWDYAEHGAKIKGKWASMDGDEQARKIQSSRPLIDPAFQKYEQSMAVIKEYDTACRQAHQDRPPQGPYFDAKSAEAASRKVVEVFGPESRTAGSLRAAATRLKACALELQARKGSSKSQTAIVNGSLKNAQKDKIASGTLANRKEALDTLVDGSGKSKKKGVQLAGAQAAAGVGSGKQVGGALRAPASKGDAVKDGKVEAITEKKEGKGFFAAVGDFFASVPLPVWTALGGAVVGGLIGGGKGALIGLAGGAVLGLGIGALSNAAKPTEQKNMEATQAEVADIKKKQDDSREKLDAFASEAKEATAKMNETSAAIKDTDAQLNSEYCKKNKEECAPTAKKREALVQENKKAETKARELMGKTAGVQDELDAMTVRSQQLRSKEDQLAFQKADLVYANKVKAVEKEQGIGAAERYRRAHQPPDPLAFNLDQSGQPWSSKLDKMSPDQKAALAKDGRFNGVSRSIASEGKAIPTSPNDVEEEKRRRLSEYYAKKVSSGQNLSKAETTEFGKILEERDLHRKGIEGTLTKPQERKLARLDKDLFEGKEIKYDKPADREEKGFFGKAGQFLSGGPEQCVFYSVGSTRYSERMFQTTGSGKERSKQQVRACSGDGASASGKAIAGSSGCFTGDCN